MSSHGFLAFEAAEQRLFDAANPQIKQYAHLKDLDELKDIAVQICWRVVRQHGTTGLFTAQTLIGRAERWATYWFGYPTKKRWTTEQQQRGQENSLRVRQAKAVKAAWLCHSLRQYGRSMRWIAARLGISLGSVAAHLKKPLSAIKKAFILLSGPPKSLFKEGTGRTDTKLNATPHTTPQRSVSHALDYG